MASHDRLIGNSPRRLSASQDLQHTEPMLPTSLPLARPTNMRILDNKPELDDLFATSSDPPLFSSDDLPASSADNYLGHRNKRQHRRAWYEEEDSVKRVCLRDGERIPRRKGPFQRNFDSGVWLGSDESLPSDEPDPAQVSQGTPVRRRPSLDQDEQDEEYEKQNEHDEHEEQLRDIEDEELEQCLQWKSDPEEVQPITLESKAMETIVDPGVHAGPVFPYWQPQPTNLHRFHELQMRAAKRVAVCVEQGGEGVDLA